MATSTSKPRITGKHKAIGIIFMIAGLLLFAYMVEKAGPSNIIQGMRRLGFGFVIVFLLGGFRQAVHAFCWVKCCEPPYKLRFRDAFKARLMGEAAACVPSVNSNDRGACVPLVSIGPYFFFRLI